MICLDCNRDEANCTCYRTCPICDLEYSLRFERCPHMQRCESCEDWVHKAIEEDDGRMLCWVCYILEGLPKEDEG